MTSDQIANVILSITPSIVAIITMLGVIFRVLKDFRELRHTVTDMKAVEELNDKMANVLQENYELKQKINELLTKIDHVERK